MNYVQAKNIANKIGIGIPETDNNVLAAFSTETMDIVIKLKSVTTDLVKIVFCNRLDMSQFSGFLFRFFLILRRT